MKFYGPHVKRTMVVSWVWHENLSRLTFKPFETSFETFAHFLPIVLQDTDMLRIFSQAPSPTLTAPPLLTTEGRAVFAHYHGFAADFANRPAWKTKRTTEQAEAAVTTWVSQRLLYFSRYVTVVDEIDLWWIALCGTSHYAGMYEQPSWPFVAYVRQNVGFVDKPPVPAKHTADRRRLV